MRRISHQNDGLHIDEFLPWLHLYVVMDSNFKASCQVYSVFYAVLY